MPNTKKFTELIEELRTLIQKEKEQKENAYRLLEQNFFSLRNELAVLYEHEKDEILQNEIKPFVEQYSFLTEKSILQIIKKQRQETFHSLILEHLWGEIEFHEVALANFVEQVEGIKEKSQLKKWILENDYSIKCEEQTHNKKRIDIIIRDNKGRWVIVIENKIDSSVHSDNDGKTQLANYFDYAKRKFKNCECCTFILLSHSNNRKYTRNNCWLYADYYDVYNSLLKHQSNDDVKEYLKTLFSLLFPNADLGEKTSLCSAKNFYNQIISTKKQTL